MASGYCPALLQHINDVAEGNSMGKKLHVMGFLKMLFCCQNSSVSPLNDQYPSSGNKRTLTVAYRERPLEDVVQDEDTCEINRIPVKKEWTMPALNHKQTSFFITDEEIKKYCDEFSRTLGIGTPATIMMKEHYDLFVESANILLKVINADLVAEMATQFGTNITIGSATGKVININRGGADLTLNDGILELFNDLRENEHCGDPCMVGGGNFASLELALKGVSASQAGMDISKFGLPPFFWDKSTQTIWGDNSLGVFAKGSAKFLGFNKYLGNYGGAKGSSIFFTAPFPIEEFAECNDMLQCLKDLRLDVQMKYIDCPTEITVGAGEPQTVNRGWQIILSKEYAMWVQPTDGYASGDPLEDTNGTLLYYVDNNCVDCEGSTGGYAYEA